MKVLHLHQFLIQSINAILFNYCDLCRNHRIYEFVTNLKRIYLKNALFDKYYQILTQLDNHE